MKTKPPKPATSKALTLAMAAMLSATSAQAADTDIYLNKTSTVLPNVMFAIDTSGSMRSRLWMPPDYNKARNYSGGFDRTKVYFSPDGKIPDTAGGLTALPLASMAGCQFANAPLRNDGFTGIRVALAFSPSAGVNYPKNLWTPSPKVYIDTSDASDVHVECSDDSGNHGAASGGGGKYASQTPYSLYSTDPNAEIDWGKYPFVTVFTGNYLNYKANPPADVIRTREDLQTRVVSDAIKRTPDIFAGLSRLYNKGGAIIRGARDNSVRANQQNLLRRLNNTNYAGVTPLAGSLLELLHYFHGKDMYQSRARSRTDSNILRGNRYISPITSSCQKNYVIMVTDGRPYRDSAANRSFKASNSKYPNYHHHLRRSTCLYNCLDELAKYLSRQDAASWLPNLYDLDGDTHPDPQTVKLYPIGMQIQQSLLDNAARAAGTDSYYAADAEEFEDAFVDILATIRNSGGVSMVTAASSNDRFSKTSNRDYLYYGQFVPGSKFSWRGNLKKYRYAYNEHNVAYITDTDTENNPDITADDGTLVSTARSYWSASADGNDALRGGVLDRLKRRGGTARLIRGINSADDTNVSIFEDANQLSVDNTFMLDAMNVDGRSNAERRNIVKYALGQDIHDEDGDGNKGEQRGSIGAIVRSSPVAVQYGGTKANPDIVVFATTSDGVLHAFDDATGDELWAVVMPEAYPNLVRQYDNYFSISPWWGVDGSIATRVIDKDGDGVIEAGNGDKVYLYISGGMSLRRWFMLDVTNARASADQARLVRRGKYDADDANWDELGLSLSPMVPVSYRLDDDEPGVFRKAMIYANGWDPTAEFSYLPENTMGRGLSLYDADNGSVLWKMTRSHGGGADMKYAFATQPTPVDLNGDGYTDLIYALDINARLWRFNVNNGASAHGSLIDGAILADFGTDQATLREQRRTYKRVDAAVVTTGTGTEVILAVGTGDRMNPLSKLVQDKLIVIRDKTATSGEKPDDIIELSDLYNATSNVAGEGSDEARQAAITDLNTKPGWYIDLPFGTQKAISAPLISSGIVNFAVYQVGGAAANPCEDNSMGSGVLYRLNVLDATPVTDHSGDGNLTADDRSVNIRGSGIPGDVGFHTSSSGVKTIIVNRDPFVNLPDRLNPNRNAEPSLDFHGDSAGYWFEERKR